MLKRFLLVLGLAFAVSVTSGVHAESVVEHAPLDIYMFWGDGCPHCAQEYSFLQDILVKYGPVTLHRFEVYHHPENLELLNAVASELHMDASGVPFLVIGNKAFVGFAPGITTISIENTLDSCVQKPSTCVGLQDVDFTSGVSTTQVFDTVPLDSGNVSADHTTLSVPILGAVDLSSLSLPVLSVVLGLIDGFNPCAMWVLLFLISLLVGLNNRFRMWLLGFAFIFSSAFVYFLFMVAWLKLALFLGFVPIVRFGIGFLALVCGLYHLREYLITDGSGCHVIDESKREFAFGRIRRAVGQGNLLLALLGISLLAFMINLVELLCSAGFPAIFTQILALNNLPSWEYFAYILLYIFFFMLDDLVVFVLAMVTLHLTGFTTKYSRLSKLIGGALLLLIGVLMLFKPSALFFS